jgi:uncharacterized membrane protein (DUF4010 family)
MPEQSTLFYRFGVALLIGFLIGLQREYSYDKDRKSEHKQFAGVRTFPLFGLGGAAAAMLSDLLASAWVFAAFLVAMTGLIIVAYYFSARRGELGMTTGVAPLATPVPGALCYHDELLLAIAAGVATMALLTLKLELHGLVAHLTREDMLAVIKFAVITAIVLPVLPNQPISDQPPFDVVNPYKVWLMVVLISGISFLGYMLIKVIGPKRGIGLTGILGGLASSTATTLSFSERSHQNEQLGKPFALAVSLAWTVMFVRILVEVGAVYRPLLAVLWLPISAAGAAALAYGIFLYFGPRAMDDQDVRVTNPFELRPAFTFGLLYAVILVVARTAQLYLGETGLFLSSIVSGLADVDAITLSVAELSRTGELDQHVASQAIVLAAMSNTISKGAIVVITGSSTLRRAILPGVLLILATGLAATLLL